VAILSLAHTDRPDTYTEEARRGGNTHTHTHTHIYIFAPPASIPTAGMRTKERRFTYQIRSIHIQSQSALKTKGAACIYHQHKIAARKKGRKAYLSHLLRPGIVKASSIYLAENSILV
jgi:hypothetical protein